MRNTIDTATDFGVNPAITDVLKKVVFFDEFYGYVGKVDARIFGTSERGIEIEVAYIVGVRLDALAGEVTVGEKFDDFKQASFWCRRC